MKNVRLDSLPANRPVGTQDCPVCTKRRIKCDRTIPACMKCTSRTIECPGYSPIHYRWNLGIASRGKFAGKSAPVEDVPDRAQRGSKSVKAQPTSSSTLNTSEHQTPSGHPNHCSAELLPDPTQSQALSQRYLSDNLSASLFQQFYAAVVPKLRWFDLPQDPWRQIFYPIAQHSQSLRLSVASVSAAFLSTAADTSDQRTRFLLAHQWLRDQSLHLLSRKIGSNLLPDPTSAAHASVGASSIDILASMLMLCYGEAFVPGSKDWKLHLRACRIVLDGANLQNSLNSVEGFLLKEVADLETLSNISVFHQQQLSSSMDSALCHIYTGSFWTFTGLVNEITRIERQRYTAKEALQPTLPIDMALWQARAEKALQSVNSSIDALADMLGDRRLYYETVVRAHYYAVLIYSYQALGQPDEVASLSSALVDPLMSDIQFVLEGATRQFAHVLFFPLLIAGTESGNDVDRQSLIEKYFLEALASCGVWCNHTALEFLQVFWSDSGMQSPNWIQYARENESQIGTFIAF